MARLLYEFFRPRVSLPVIFPIGVVAQDDKGVVYRSIPDVQLPEDVETAFYGLDARESFMNDDFLTRIEVVIPETGETERIEPSDPRLLDLLQHRGTHHFLYGPVVELDGSAEAVAAAESERLSDKDARKEVVMKFGDPATKAVLEAYA